MAWVVGVSIAALLLTALIATNVIDPDSAFGVRASIAAIALGFFTAGLYAGLRAKAAPILYGVCIGLFSLLVWFVLNVLASVLFPDFGWSALTPNMAVGLVLVMIVAAVLGARAGYRKTL
jgi:hypothetical protein